MKTIKTILKTLCLTVALFFFVSCDDNEVKAIVPPDQLLEGNWSYEAAKIDVTVNGQDIVDYLIEVFELPATQANQIASMIENESFEFTDSSWKFNHDKTFTVLDDDQITTGTWNLSVDYKKLNLMADGETNSVDVLVLTATKLQVFMSIVEEVDIDEDGINERLVIDATLTLKK